MSTGSAGERCAQGGLRLGGVEPVGQGEIAGDAVGQPVDARLRRPRCDAIFASGGDSRRAAGWEMSVATSDMENSGDRRRGADRGTRS